MDKENFIPDLCSSNVKELSPVIRLGGIFVQKFKKDGEYMNLIEYREKSLQGKFLHSQINPVGCSERLCPFLVP